MQDHTVVFGWDHSLCLKLVILHWGKKHLFYIYISKTELYIEYFFRRSESDTQLSEMENESRLLKSNPVSVPQNNINRQSTPVFIECGSNSMYS